MKINLPMHFLLELGNSVIAMPCSSSKAYFGLIILLPKTVKGLTSKS
jgi:hypothetical protein